jgi:2-phospho-L-lactate/phosphoenolpyruvate guanylyltransferase
MPTIVVPFRGQGGKQRLEPLSEPARKALAAAMLDDVLAACLQVGRTFVVAPRGAASDVSAPAGAELVTDPGHGQGAAVGAALALVPSGPVLVVNADLPCVTARDLYALLGELPPDGLALAEAADGTTNALALASPHLFQPVYGTGSAARFRALDPSPAAVRTVPIPNLIDDVDTLDDLRRLGARLGPKTRRALASLEQQLAWAAA